MASQGPRVALLVSIGVLGLWFLRALLIRLGQAASRRSAWVPSAGTLVTGFVTTFFDTLGIGNFATTTTIFRTWNLVPDELIPGTLNVGHSIAAVLGAFIFIGLVPVTPETLLPTIVASGLGAWLGSGVVARLPRYRIRLGMGTALLVAAAVMLLTQLQWLPGGGEALGLEGWRWTVAVLGTFVLGSLMTLGIGLYAPCMIMVSLLGMNPLAAFPIMMGSCAFLMPVGSLRFVGTRSYSVPAVLVALYLVKSLPLTAVRWGVVAVVLYTAVAMLRSAAGEAAATATPGT